MIRKSRVARDAPQSLTYFRTLAKGMAKRYPELKYRDVLERLSQQKGFKGWDEARRFLVEVGR